MPAIITFLLAFAGLTYKRPLFAFGLLLAGLPTYLIRFSAGPLPTTFLELMIVVFLFVLILTHSRKLNFAEIKKLGHINWAIILFLVACLIAVAVSPETLKALGLLKAFIIEPILLFYAAVLLIKTPEDLKLILKFLLASAGAISLFGLFQYITNFSLPLQFWGSGDEPKRITSFFTHPNELALYLAPLLAFYFILTMSRLYVVGKKTQSLILIIMTAALGLTFSRGAWAGLVLGLVLLLAPKISYKKLLAGLMVLIALSLSIPTIRERLTINDPSSNLHLALMKAGFTKLLSSPLLGNGLYGFRSTLAEQNFRGEIHNYPHNIILSLWLETGLLGVLSFFMIILLALKNYKKQPTTIRFAAASYLLVMILQGAVETPYLKNDLSVVFWFIISLFFVL
ncbi:MAG TPA: O-antigen ligase family protein [Patescibacteria group bacterium]|jgi:putative inorganic carbon (HCO3(-)) transporter|nr:O-antigen ligase family protein [Patescibacteria group bacterium]